jgi:HSP20 family protein
MTRNIVRTSPFADISRFDPFRLDPLRSIDELMRDLTMLPTLGGLDTEPGIRLDVEETDQDFMVKADLPGMKKEEIKVAIDGNLVTIEAQTATETEEKFAGRLVRRERYAGQQYRRFSLPQDIDDKGAAASYDNGVLSLKLPKKSGSVGKTLAIK